jgi:hypothetical protein
MKLPATEKPFNDYEITFDTSCPAEPDDGASF